MAALGQPQGQPTAQDLLTGAGLMIQQAVMILSESMNQAAALAQAMQQIQAMLGQGLPPQPGTLDDAAGALAADMQASAAQRTS